MPNEWLDARLPLLGKNVKVLLAHEDGEGEPTVIATGKLLKFGDDGEVVLQDEMGFTHWCWPDLDMVEDT